MPIASPWYRLMRRPEKFTKLTTAFRSDLKNGLVINVGGRIYVTAGIQHNLGGGFASSTAQMIEPGRWWKFKYRLKQFALRMLRPFARTYNRLRYGNSYG